MIVLLNAFRGWIARIKGDLDQARKLFEPGLVNLRSLHSIAWIYRELALIENLSGNKELAYFYDNKGLNLFQQLGINLNTPSTHHCHRVIERMKQEGTW